MKAVVSQDARCWQWDVRALTGARCGFNVAKNSMNYIESANTAAALKVFTLFSILLFRSTRSCSEHVQFTISPLRSSKESAP